MIAPPGEAIQFQLNINYYVSLVSFVILYYDHALTLPSEIQRFWARGPLTWPTFLFFVNRYLAFLGHFPVILEAFWNTSDSPRKIAMCRHLQSYHQCLELAIQLIICVLLIIRIYALYGGERWVVGLLLAIVGVDVVVGCWSTLSNAPIPMPPLALTAQGCSEPLGNEQGFHLAIAWGGQLVFDATCFVLTVQKTFAIGRASHRTLIINTLLYDGALYFAVMTAANLANIFTFLLAPPILKGVVSTFVNIISVTMMSRLMLNIRDPKIHTPTSGRMTQGFTLTAIDLNEESEGCVCGPIVFECATTSQ